MVEGTLSRRVIGRLAGVLFLASGLITAASVPLPAPPELDRTALAALGNAAFVVGAVLFFLPWDRWSARASLWLVPLAFGMIAYGNALSFSLPYTDGIFFVVAFVWLGISHARWTSLALSPLAAVAYIVPILFRPGDTAAAVSTAAVVVPVCVLVGETLGWIAQRLRRTERVLVESEKRYAEAYELEHAVTERLRALDDIKNSLVEAVSHELRTPLTSVLGIALTLERQGHRLSAHQLREVSGRLGKSARRLDQLMGDLLDVDRLARGIVHPNRQLTDVAKLVRRVVEDLEHGDHPVEIEGDMAVASVDHAKVERIVEHLFMNAVRHTAPGTRIWVRVRELDDGVLIAVEDAGPGVPPQARARVFEPFWQVTAPAHSPGLGVGLAVVARLAELHGGQAWVEDREGGGSSFRVFLPNDQPPKPHGEPDEDADDAIVAAPEEPATGTLRSAG